MPSDRELRDLYDEQLRGAGGFPGATVEQDGPILRVTGTRQGFVAPARDLELAPAEVDALIARTVAHFQALGQPFEWKTRAHDLPGDITDRLLAAGFLPEDSETVMIGDATLIAAPAELPGILVRRTTDARDVERIAELHTRVWGRDSNWLGRELLDRLRSDPDQLVIFIAEDVSIGEVVAAAWMVPEGRDFVGLWGGSTLASHRGRGIYRRLVAERAALARGIGRRYLQVDASADSAPILARLGLRAVTTTTPYVWTPRP